MPLLNPNEKCAYLKFLRDFVFLFGKIVLTIIVSIFQSIIPKSKKSLEDEIVLITGAGRGLGRELALKFTSLKAIVVLWDIDEESIQHVEKEIRSTGGRAYSYVCDVRDPDHVKKIGREVENDVGYVTILVNNAGVMQNLPFTELVNDKIKQTFEVNALSHFWTIKQFLPRMIELEKGHVVAVSSMAGLVGWLYMTDYCATKFAIVGMMESLEEELRLLGQSQSIHCTTVCPVTIDTGMNQNPTTRSSWLVPILSAECAAANIVLAVQRNERIVTVPRRVYYPLTLQRFFPRKVTQLILDFLEYNVLPNDNNTDV